MTILVISLDNNTEKFQNFLLESRNFLNEELLVVNNPLINSNKTFLFKEFSQAGLNLEFFLMNSDYYSTNRKFDYVLICWGDYSTNNISYINDILKSDKNLTKDVLLVSNLSLDQKHNWVFGNIVSIVKWLSSLFKIEEDFFENLQKRDSYILKEDKINIAIWFALRIGLNVLGVEDIKNENN